MMQVAAVCETAFLKPLGLERAFRDHHTHDAEGILQAVFLRLAQKGVLQSECREYQGKGPAHRFSRQQSVA